jgi:SAM-dependent methyltransferase
VQTKVWENQGRTPEFIRFFSSLLDGFPAARSLEIGCGEGFLLAARRKGEKFAVDLSTQAIRKAKTRAQAHFSLALAERLPFPNGHFDLVTSVGVMEHFLDTGEALREIRRVLKPGGHYVSLVHVRLTAWERLGQVLSDFVFPRPRPIRLARWAWQRVKNRLRGLRPQHPLQPIQNQFTTASARTWLTHCGFRIAAILHTRKDPSLPLIGPYVVIYDAQKMPGADTAKAGKLQMQAASARAMKGRGSAPAA